MPSASPRRRVATVSAFAAIFAIPATVGASGTITTTGATITPGSDTAIVSIDPAAPPSALPTLTPAVAPPAPPPAPSILTAPLATPGPGTPFHAMADVTIPGGTYDVTDVTIDPGVTVTMSGAVTIHASGNVVVLGRSVSASSGASIALEAAGTITLAASSNLLECGIETTGSASPISLRAAGGVFATTASQESRSSIRTADGAIDVAAVGSTAPIDLRNTDLDSGNGDVTIAGAQDVSLGNANVTADDGAARLWSGRNTRLDAGLITAAAGATVTAGGGTIAAPAATIRCSAAPPAPAAIALRAGGAVTLPGTYLSAPGVSGPVIVESGATLSFGDAGGGAAMILSGGGVRLSATTGLTVNGGAEIDAFEGLVRLESSGGTLVLGPGAELLTVGADVECVAPSITAGQFDGPATAAISATVAGSLSFHATQGAAAVVANVSGTSRFEVAAAGDVTFRGTASVHETMRLSSLTGDVSVVGASFEGRARVPSVTTTTGDLVVETFVGDGSIDASGATLTTLAGRQHTGSILLLVHDAATLPASLVPKKLTLSRPRRSDGKRTLRMVGTADLGLSARRFGDYVDVVVGAVTVRDVHRTDDGATQRFASIDDSVRMTFKESAAGSSKGTIDLSVTGDFPVTDPFDGTLSISVTDATDAPGPSDARATGRFAFVGGRYADTPVTRVAPAAVLRSAAWNQSRPGKGTLALAASIPLPAARPETAPAVSVKVLEYGAAPTEFAFTADAATFRPQGSARLRSTAPSAGKGSVTLDYAKGTVTVALSGLTLPAPGDPAAFSGAFEITVGATRVLIPARLSRKGSRTAY